MAKIKVHINKPDPDKKTIDHYKYARHMKMEIKRAHTFKGMYRWFRMYKTRGRRKWFFYMAVLLTLLLLILLDKL